MPRISALPPHVVPAGADELPIVDVSESTTKKITVEDLGNNGEWIGTDGVADDAITPDKQSPLYAGSLLVASQTISSATFADTNMTLTLPSIGIWVIMASIRSSMTNANDWGEMRLMNTTDGVDADSITNESDWINGLTNASGLQNTTSKTVVCITTDPNTVITLQARKGAANNWSLTSDTNGKSSLTAFRIG